MIKETKTSSSSRAITILMELVIQGTKTTVTRRDPHWKKWELFLLPLPQVDLLWPQTISVPIPMLPTPTPDQAHHSHRAAWDIQLPPSSLHSTHIRHIGTELHPNNVSALLLMLQDCAAACLEPGLGHKNVLYNHTFNTSDRQVPPPFTEWSSGSQIVPVFGLDLKRKC